jgi:hypothetical protein
MTLTKKQIENFYRDNEDTFSSITRKFYEDIANELRKAHPGGTEEDFENLLEMI